MIDPTHSAIRCIRCETAEEFLSAVNSTNAMWESDGLEAKWLYRGHRDSRRQLLPAAWREPRHNPRFQSYREFVSTSGIVDDFSRSQNLKRPGFDLYGENETKWMSIGEDLRKERLRQLVTQIIVETQLVRDFWTVANDVGHRIPKPEWNFDENCVSDLLHRIGSGGADTLFEHIAFATAQHHRIPTRLLDWTFDPHVAAYFASSAGSALRSDVTFVEVWAIRRQALLRTQQFPTLKSFRIPRSELPYLHAQSGCFLWISHPNAHFLLTGVWPTQDAVLQMAYEAHGAGIEHPWAYRISLPKVLAPQVCKRLSRARVSHAHLMPSLDNVAEEVWGSVAWRTKESLQQ